MFWQTKYYTFLPYLVLFASRTGTTTTHQPHPIATDHSYWCIYHCLSVGTREFYKGCNWAYQYLLENRHTPQLRVFFFLVFMQYVFSVDLNSVYDDPHGPVYVCQKWKGKREVSFSSWSSCRYRRYTTDWKKKLSSFTVTKALLVDGILAGISKWNDEGFKDEWWCLLFNHIAYYSRDIQISRN